MSPPFHYLSYRCFVHATEDEAEVRRALSTVVGDDADPTAGRAEGYHGNPITILSGELSRARDVDAVFRRLADAGVTDLLLSELDRRLDEEVQFHLRLDKAAAHGGRLAVAGDGDVIALSGKVEAYPAKRDKALSALRDYLEEL